jgi:hypothetical protein
MKARLRQMIVRKKRSLGINGRWLADGSIVLSEWQLNSS